MSPNNPYRVFFLAQWHDGSARYGAPELIYEETEGAAVGNVLARNPEAKVVRLQKLYSDEWARFAAPAESDNADLPAGWQYTGQG